VALTLQNPQTRAAASVALISAVIFVIALIIGTVLRVLWLSDRPMHTDEAVQAILYLQPLLEGRSFTYNPHDGHGPVLVYSARVLMWLFRAKSLTEISEITLRLVPVLYGLGLISVLVLLSDGLGKFATALAALFVALSPMQVYYSRYFIMEMPFVFFSTAAIAGAWRYYVSRNAPWLLMSGVCLGLMHATKETCVFPWAAGFLALIGTSIMEYFSAGAGLGVVQRQRKKKFKFMTFVWAAVLAVATSYVLFSSFFHDLKQPFESIKTYVYYLKRAGGSGHEKSFFYYLQLWLGRRDVDGFYSGELVFVILALIGFGRAFFSTPGRYENEWLRRFFALYTAILLFAYSVISYKTPWTILGAELGLLILAGVGLSTLLTLGLHRWVRLLVIVLVGLALAQVGAQVLRQNYDASADPERNPYVYSHATPNVPQLADKMKKLAQAAAEPKEVQVWIASHEHGWPLPWYFRDWKYIGYTDTPADKMFECDLVVTADEWASAAAYLGEKTHTLLPESYLLRPGRPLRLFVKKSLLPAPAAPAPSPAPTVAPAAVTEPPIAPEAAPAAAGETTLPTTD
jgi:uncharacterized protein (TIGR03663 family)